MTVLLERVANLLLGSRGKAYCEDCLASVLNCDDRDQTRRAMISLSDLSSFRRAFGRCAECDHDRLVIRLEAREM